VGVVSTRRTVAPDVERYLELLWRPGEVRELRVPKWDGRSTAAGYFDDPAALAVAAAAYDGRANVYVTLNPVVPDLLARYANRVEPRAALTTSDRDVAQRRWLYVDVDPVRPSGISASDAEVGIAHATARRVAEHLRDNSWGLPVTSASGNGYQLLYPVALPNDDASTALVAGVLRCLAERFDDDLVRIDTTVANAARIAAVIGTLKMKGDSTPERPHRRSALALVPEVLDPVAVELLRALAPTAGAHAPSTGNDAGRMPEGWVRDLLDAAGVPYRELTPDAKGVAWYGLERCPAHPDDGAPWQCGVGEAPDGMALGKCFHNRGRDWRWKDFKAALGLRTGATIVGLPRPDGPLHADREPAAASEGATTPDDGTDQPGTPHDAWPAPPDRAAFHGLAGELVDAVAPGTEADPVALLGSILAVFGALTRGPYAFQGSMQPTNLFVVLAGDTASGRKGTAHGIVRALFTAASPTWEHILAPGLGSGEGLIGHLQRNETDPRALVMESELGRLLGVMARDGSVLSPILRDAWDGVPVGRILSRESAVVVAHHVGLLAHITPVELRARLSHVDAANGFGNRFLWLAVRRPRLVPFPGDPLADPELAPLLDALGLAVDFGSVLRRFELNEAARDRWEEVYLRLALQPRWGLAGALTARAEAQITRLALVHAALERATAIEPAHLEAALALWAYAERSVRFLFGESTGDRWADIILAELRDNGPATLAQLKQTHGFHDPARLANAVELLLTLGLVGRTRAPSSAKGGRPSPLLTLLERPAA
jgi:hypothetical protein